MLKLNQLSGFGAASSMAIITPTDIPGLKIWLKADAIGGLSNGDPVGTWADQSGNGNDFTQATGGLQPLWETNQLNGLPIVRFDGIDDVLHTTAPTGDGAWTCFLVIKSVDNSAEYIFEVGDGTHAIIQGFAGPIIEYFDTPRTTVGNISTSAFQVITIAVGNTVTGLWALGGTYFGSSWWPGDMAELLLYNSALSAGDQSKLQRYLKVKYGL